MKRVLYLILTFVFVFMGTGAFAQDAFSPYNMKQGEVLFNQSIRKADYIDPNLSTTNRNSYYPGFRGANQMVVYTPAFGERTNTNEFGTEAIIIGNVVNSISGADSVIPANGIVISGHGIAKEWMNKNLMIGSKVSIDRTSRLVTAYTTSDSYIYSAQSQLKDVKNIVEKYKQTLVNYDSRKADYYISQAEKYINKAINDKDCVQKYSEMAVIATNNALAASVPYKEGELRGVWIRPTLANKDDICEVLNRLSQAGINNIFIETYYHGMTIYPSSVMESRGFIKVNPFYSNFDALDYWISEAHKRNIKVNIWFETFYAGNKNPVNNPQSIVAVRPSWANVTKRDYATNRPTASVSEHNGYFLDPANPEVQTFLLQLLCEIIQRYKPDGINLDYIRYPQSISSKVAGSDVASWGYTSYARNDFKNIYGVDPVDICTFEPLWESWNDYRRGKVTEFVQRASQICHSNDVHLTAVIFPNRQSALDIKQQDWKRWSMNGYVDGFTPLFLTCDPNTAAGLMKEVKNNISDKTKLYAGLFITFMNGSQSDLIRQIDAVRSLSLDGFSIFDYAHLSDKYIQPLSVSICNVPKPKVIQPNNVKLTTDNDSIFPWRKKHVRK